MTELKITDEMGRKLANTNVLLGTLMARKPVRNFVEAKEDTIMNLQRAGIKFRLLNLGGCSDLGYGRNMMAMRFLESECTDIIWLDDDIFFNSEDIVRLLVSERHVIGGAYRKKLSNFAEDDPHAWCCHPFEGKPIERDELGAIKVEKLGFGFIKTSRYALETIAKKRPDLTKPWPHDETKNMTKFFYFDGYGHSEDYFFCKTWGAVGEGVWVDPAIKLAHIGEFSYEGDVNVLINKVASKVAT